MTNARRGKGSKSHHIISFELPSGPRLNISNISARKIKPDGKLSTTNLIIYFQLEILAHRRKVSVKPRQTDWDYRSNCSVTHLTSKFLS